MLHFVARARIDTHQILRNRRHSPHSVLSIERVRRRTDTQVGLRLPIGRIVARTASCASKIRDFVVIIARFGQRTMHLEVLTFALLLRHGREFASLGHTPKARIRLNSKVIGRNMLDIERHGLRQRARKCIFRAKRKSINQVDGDVVETRRASLLDRRNGCRSVVAAIHRAQHLIVKRLNTNTQAIDSHTAQSRQILLAEVVGIGFERDLLDRTAVKCRATKLNRPPDPLGRRQRGRSATEIDRANSLATQEIATRYHLALHSRQRLLLESQIGVLIEVAIGANASTKRDMKIDSGHRATKITFFRLATPLAPRKIFAAHT